MTAAWFILLFAPQGQPAPQDERAFVGSTIGEVRGEGFEWQPFESVRDSIRLSTRPGAPLAIETLDQDTQALLRTKRFYEVTRQVLRDPSNQNQCIVIFKVKEDKYVTDVKGDGFVRYPFASFKDQLETQKGVRLNAEAVAADVKKLWYRKPQIFADVGYKIAPNPNLPNEWFVTFRVDEYPTILNVPILGAKAESPETLYGEVLRLKVGEPLNPYLLKLDEQDVLNRYRKKGYHFCEVHKEITPSGIDVILAWRIFEGPMVQLEEIKIEYDSKEPKIPPGDIKGWMASKENGLFSKSPFDEKLLLEDVERVKWNYRLEGFLDIYQGHPIFIKEIEFNAEKTKAVVTLRVEEGRRFRTRNVIIKGNTVVRAEELLREMTIKPGDPVSERELYRSSVRMKEFYGSLAYIDAKVDPEWIAIERTDEADVVFRITEESKTSVGRVIITGNTRTREDRIRLDLREDVIPGEEFNIRQLNRALNRLRERGWFEQSPQGVAVNFQPTNIPSVKDVVINVREGDTTRIQLAAGYSSSFGILGLIEYTQRNFDISDLPDSFSDIFSSFVGAGQVFRIRLAPGADRQQYSIDFIEPYFFGTDFSFLISFAYITTVREAWDEELFGGRVGFTRRLGFWTLGVALRGNRQRIFNVQSNAPPSLSPFIGTNTIVSVEPSIVHDSRDSAIVPTQGWRWEFAYDIASKSFGSDFNFTKLNSEFQIHFPLYTTESRTRHVFSFRLNFGHVSEFAGTEEVPISERYYAGGRGTIRGFEFRGIGPKENDIPVGGEVIVTATFEYTIPLYDQILWGAVWYDAGTLAAEWRDLPTSLIRQSVGFGFRFMVPQLSNIPIALDFGWALTSSPLDREMIVLFDLGRFFY